jgi:peptidoglycan/xylan/chitin deacetylase (PgdA/CDA1 family)
VQTTPALIRSPVPWPGGARCAVAFTFDLDAESGLHLNYSDSAHRRVALSSMLRYGPEVAVPRLVDLFRHHGMRQTFFVPGWCAQAYPAAMQMLTAAGHEIAHHGYLHEKPNELDDEREAEVLRAGIDAIAEATGRRPRGYRAPSYAFSHRTLGNLLREGFTYDSSLFGDDVPYLLEENGRTLLELPVEVSLDDWPQYVCYRELGYMQPIAAPQRAMELFRAEFDAAWNHGGMWISVWHPFVSGRLARTEAIAGLIDHMQAKGSVWFATLEEIAAHAASCAADGVWSPRRVGAAPTPPPAAPRPHGDAS